jgi:hypothetical protein
MILTHPAKAGDIFLFLTHIPLILTHPDKAGIHLNLTHPAESGEILILTHPGNWGDSFEPDTPCISKGNIFLTLCQDRGDIFITSCLDRRATPWLGRRDLFIACR